MTDDALHKGMKAEIDHLVTDADSAAAVGSGALPEEPLSVDDDARSSGWLRGPRRASPQSTTTLPRCRRPSSVRGTRQSPSSRPGCRAIVLELHPGQLTVATLAHVDR